MYGSILPLLPKLPPDPQLTVLRSCDWRGWFDDERLADEVQRRSLAQGHVSDLDLGRMLLDPPEPRFDPVLFGGRSQMIFLNTPGLFTFTKPVRWANTANFIDLFGSGDGSGGAGGWYVRGLNVILPASGTMHYYVSPSASGTTSTAPTWFIDPTQLAAQSGKVGGTSFGSFINPGGAASAGGGCGAGGPAGAGQATSSFRGGDGGAGFGGAGGGPSSNGGNGSEFQSYGSGGGGGGGPGVGGNGGLYGGGGGIGALGGGSGAQGLIAIFNGSNINSQVTIL